jgi:hypothetical protein
LQIDRFVVAAASKAISNDGIMQTSEITANLVFAVGLDPEFCKR